MKLELPVLENQDILIRAYQQSDADALVEAWRDADIQKRNNVPKPDKQAAKDWVAKCHQEAEHGLHANWAIIEKASGLFVGHRAIKNFDWRKGRASTGAWLIPAARGKGYAPASMRLAAEFVLCNWPIGRIQAECDVDNYASFRSLTKAGMEHEGVARAYHPISMSDVHKRKDQHVFSFIQSDFS